MTYGGPFLFGQRCLADAMYAPVVTRFLTYDLKLDPQCSADGQTLPKRREALAASDVVPLVL